MTDSGRVVVAGAGLAGFRTVEELRERGFAGPITLIGAEPRPPYDRPPLSKKFLAEPDLDPSLKADFAALDVNFRPDEAATGLGDELVTSRGAYPFDHLVLATGSLPVALPGDGRQRFLRTYDDALALRDLLRPGASPRKALRLVSSSSPSPAAASSGRKSTSSAVKSAFSDGSRSGSARNFLDSGGRS